MFLRVVTDGSLNGVVIVFERRAVYLLSYTFSSSIVVSHRSDVKFSVIPASPDILKRKFDTLRFRSPGSSRLQVGEERNQELGLLLERKLDLILRIGDSRK